MPLLGFYGAQKPIKMIKPYKCHHFEMVFIRFYGGQKPHKTI